MMAKRVLSSIVALAALAAAGSAQAAEPDSNAAGQVRIGITGQVPVLCRVSVDAAMVPQIAGRVSLGTMEEFCNNPTGYRVVVSYPQLAAPAKLIVDGREILLGTSGFAVVAESDRAGIVERDLQLELTGPNEPAQLSFRIEPR